MRDDGKSQFFGFDYHGKSIESARESASHFVARRDDFVGQAPWPAADTVRGSQIELSGGSPAQVSSLCIYGDRYAERRRRRYLLPCRLPCLSFKGAGATELRGSLPRVNA